MLIALCTLTPMVKIAFQLPADETRELPFLAKSCRMTVAGLVRQIVREAREEPELRGTYRKPAVVEKRAKKKDVH